MLMVLNSNSSYSKQLGYFADKITEDIVKFRSFFFQYIGGGNEERRKKYLDTFIERKDVIEFLNNFKLDDVEKLDKICVKFLAIYCQSVETLVLLDLYNFLKEQVIKSNESIHNSIKELYGKEIADNFISSDDKKVILSFVPFFDGFYFKIQNSLLNSKKCINEYNNILKKRYPYLEFKEKSFDIFYKKLDLNILNNYLEIRRFLMECSLNSLKKLFEVTKVEPFFSSFNSSLTSEKLFIKEKSSFLKNRKDFYKKLIDLCNNKVTVENIYKIINKKTNE